MESKLCACCGEDKPLECFPKDPRMALGRRSYCRPCTRKKKREARLRKVAREPGWEQERSAQRWANMSAEERYFYRISKPSQRGLSRDAFYDMLAAQGGACPICERNIVLRFGAPVLFVVDHDHVTGETRGILCNKCNLAIGHFDDLRSRCLRAAEYLSVRKD